MDGKVTRDEDNEVTGLTEDLGWRGTEALKTTTSVKGKVNGETSLPLPKSPEHSPQYCNLTCHTTSP